MTDEESIINLRRGDKAVEAALLRKYLPLVKSVAARFFLCGGEIEDLVQEGMFGLYSAINGFGSGGVNFSAYAYTCIRNAVISAVKKNNGDKYSALNNFVPLLEIGDTASPDSPEDELIKREDKREFIQKISKNLSSFEFKVTVMYVNGITVQEIAHSLNKTQKSVSNALARAKKKLLRLYKPEV